MKNYMIRGLHHIGIPAKDPEGACKFYTDILGFRKIYENDNWFVENGGLVIEFLNGGKDAIYPKGPLDHFAMEVLGIEELTEELKEKGVVEPETEIQYLPQFFPTGIKILFFEGPCGERIELFEHNSGKAEVFN